jgi:hypothetical protein
MQDQSLVRRVDHLVVRGTDPAALFSIFTQQLLLPQAWPVSTNPFYTSGAIHLGNANLEIMKFGEQEYPTRLYGIAFELLPFETSLPLLSERGIPHTPPMPFYLVDDQGWQVTAWTVVYLGGLMGDTTTSRLFFPLSQKAPKETWESGSLPKPFNRRFGLPFIFNTIYPRGMTFATSYNPAWRSQHIFEEPPHTGLDVQRIYEITVGTNVIDQAYPCWKSLLTPHKEVAAGVWELPDGMHIRLVEHRSNGLRRMVWQVTSLNRAMQFLHKRGMVGKEHDGMPTIDQKKIQGLDIRLVQ